MVSAEEKDLYKLATGEAYDSSEEEKDWKAKALQLAEQLEAREAQLAASQAETQRVKKELRLARREIAQQDKDASLKRSP